MKNEILEEKISIMDISKETENKLKKSKIAQISDLCSTTKTDLMKIGLDTYQSAITWCLLKRFNISRRR